jgi:putative flippase GtrA
LNDVIHRYQVIFAQKTADPAALRQVWRRTKPRPNEGHAAMLPGVVGRAFMLVKPVAAYGTVSVLTAALEFVLLQSLLLLHATQTVAVSTAFLSAAIFQFLMLRHVIFRATHRPVALQVNAYVAGTILSWLAVLASVTFLTWALPLGTLMARAIVIPLLFPVNYLANKYWIFRS